MGSYSLVQLIDRKEPLICGYLENCFKIGDKYLLCEDSSTRIEGEILWKAVWEHNPTRVVYIEEKDIIITDRITMIGPSTLKQGICAIDINTGKYLWKHFFNSSYEERRAMKTRIPDINLVKGIGKVDSITGYIYVGGFKIRVDDGTYEYME